MARPSRKKAAAEESESGVDGDTHMEDSVVQTREGSEQPENGHDEDVEMEVCSFVLYPSGGAGGWLTEGKGCS